MISRGRSGRLGAILLGILALFKAGCTDPLANDQVCLDAGYALSNRVYDCTGSPESANDRFDWYRDRFSCVAPGYLDPNGFTGTVPDTDPRSPLVTYQCVDRLRQLSCDQVLNEAALDASITRLCPGVVTRNAGPLPEGGAGMGGESGQGGQGGGGQGGGGGVSGGGQSGAGGMLACTPGSTRPCYSGDAPTRGVGLCHEGAQTCGETGAGFTSVCVGEVTPTVHDLCSPGDENCDGKEDCDFTLTDAAATSLSTGLVWQRATAGKVNWAQASTLCAQLSLDGLTGFRLPTLDEWIGLSLPGDSPQIDLFVFDPGEAGGGYWAVSPLIATPAEVWNPTAGAVVGYEPEDALYQVRCVKSP
jgi:hypothetical protein